MTTSSKPIVAIDIRELGNPYRAGKANVVYFVVRELLRRRLAWQPLFYSRVPITDPVLPPGRATQRLIGGVPGLRARWLARDIEAQGARLAIFPTGYGVTPWMRLPYLLFVYDLVAFSSFSQTLPWKVRLAERLLLPLAARKAAHILAISEFTKQELINRLGLPADKITVFPLAADPKFHQRSGQEAGEELQAVRRRYNLPDKFFLFVGTLEPRKNIKRLVIAHQSLPAKIKAEYPLVLAGKEGWLREPFTEMLDRLKVGTTVRHLAYVPFRDLPFLFNLATVCVYPSLYEGFGLPPLEAMASGCPVITSATSSLPEVVGEAALCINPEKTDELAKAMAKLATNHALREELRQKGLARARQFSWEKAAQIVDEVISQQLRDQPSS